MAENRGKSHPTSPNWPGNTSGFPRRKLLMLLGRGKFRAPSWSCCSCDPTADKWLKMGERMDGADQTLTCVSVFSAPFQPPQRVLNISVNFIACMNVKKSSVLPLQWALSAILIAFGPDITSTKAMTCTQIQKASNY